MIKGERQVQPTLVTISPDHKYRYQWVASKLTKDDIVLDACCGVGYGSYIMAKANPIVVYAFDESMEAIDYANKYYSDVRINYKRKNYVYYSSQYEFFTRIVCFEAIEHVGNPTLLLAKLHQWLDDKGILYISSPNESINPYSREKFPFHTRHWTASEFEKMLNEAGFKVNQWYSQKNKVSTRMDNHPFGRTMIAVCNKL